MTKIAITALNAEGNPYSFGEVVVRLVDAGSGGAVDGGVIVAPRPVRLDEDGGAEVDLTPTADVDPPGTCYAFTVAGVAPTVVRYLEVPSPNIVGPSEVPYAWDDPSLQVVFAEPPTFVPAPGSGTVGQVVTVVDNGDGKVYELGDLTDTGTTDASELTTGTLAFARLPIGTTSTTVRAGNDAAYSDSRTPTAHKTSHATGGSDALAPSDIGAVPTSRQIAGLDLTADRDAAALRAALGLWTTIANETLGSASGSRTYDITGYRFVRITVAARSNRYGSIDSIRLRFNGDTGSNYSTNAAAFITSISAFDIAGEYTSTDRSGYAVIQFGYMAGAWLTGSSAWTGPSSTATTAANSISNGFAWKGATSAAPTSIEVYTATGQFVAGSSFLVEGRT